MIVVGSDVLILHHLSLRADPRWNDNEEALRRLRGSVKGVTIYGLLDLVGVISRHAGEKSGRELYLSYLRSEEHRILFPPHPDSWEEHIENVMRYLAKGLSYKDALEAMVLDTTPEVQLYLTWRTAPAGRLPVKTRTPSELTQQRTFG
ncbi:MAG: hypothetical protein RMJ28_05760 [Nitrososphaerota archaeon]|nr:hypothetical protein [Candidatus Calditenuaceae archaeon]MDW8073720.1 hypothetical protein [Nitrososphaerota archaeon]